MKKNGFTLVELLVGMVISLLCIIMMLSLFQQLSRSSLASTRAADYDTQLETGMLISQKLLQNAGYGTGASADVMVVAPASATASAPAGVYWRFQSAGPILVTSATAATSTASATSATYANSSTATTAYTCNGLTETVSSGTGATYIHNLMLRTNTSCNNAPSAITATTTWNTQSLVRINSTTSAPIFTFTAAGTCAPYGTQNVQSGTKITIVGTRADVNVAKANAINRAVCIRNIAN